MIVSKYSNLTYSDGGLEILALDEFWNCDFPVERVGAAARYGNPSIRRKTEQWLRRAREAEIPVEDETLRRLADVASVTTLMAQVQGSWHVALSLPLHD